MKLLNLAIFKLLLFLITGILLGYYYPGALPANLAYPLLLSMGCWMGLARLHNAHWPFEGLCLLFFALTGYLTLQHPETGLHNQLETATQATGTRIDFEVLSPLKKGRSHFRFEVAAYTPGTKGPSERLILRVDTTHARTAVLVPGYHYTALVNITKPPAVAYPGAFDYSSYLRKQNICFLAEVSPEHIFPTREKASWRSYFYRCSEVLTRNLHHSGAAPLSRGLFDALVLGKREHLDTELYDDLRTAGGAHLVALSGLHIGVFTYFIGLLLWPVMRMTRSPYLHFILLSMILTGYVLLTGGSASVVRAAVMFGFLSYTTLIHRRASALNSLILSAFFLLLFQPQFLFDTGFQLSYAAVTGILLVYPVLAHLWRPSHRWVRAIWNAAIVSLGAQAFTAPLVLYYFGQLPGSFLITNLVLTPIFTILLPVGYLAMGVLLFSELPWWFTELLDQGARALKMISHYLVFPEWVISDLPTLTIPGIVLLYLLLLSLLAGYYQPRYLLAACLAMILLQGGYIYTLHSQRESSLVICHGYGESILLKRVPGKTTLFYNGEKRANESATEDRIPSGLTFEDTRPLPFFIKINQDHLFIPGDVPFESLPRIPEGSTLLLTGSVKVNLERLIVRTRPKAVVADGSNYPSYIARWRQTCDKKNIPFHYTGEKGYYMLK